MINPEKLKSNPYRSHFINELNNIINESVKLSGWIVTKRDHGSIIFLELRDSSGIIQLVMDHNILNNQQISLESVISIEGIVKPRSAENINPKKEFGHLEVQVTHLNVLSYCENLPFLPELANTVHEDLQLKYRYIALRNKECLSKILMKAELIKCLREFMENNQFTEFQTPIITASSPEGARDFVIPSRLHPGKFYALPQAPQIYKQLLMVSGINRYFQIAPCFRDEDARKDRNYGEFYQMDFEMSFATENDVLRLLTNLMTFVLGKLSNLKTYFHTITHDESLEKYGTDKPNLNNKLFIEDFTDIFAKSSMDLFKKKIESGAVVKGCRMNYNNINANGILDHMWTERKFRAAYILKESNEIKGPIAKFLPESIVNNNEIIFFVCDEKEKALINTGHIIKHFEPTINSENHVVFVRNFPMFEKNDDGTYTFKHNPFSMPNVDSINESDLSNVYAYQYDMVLNGYELASGSVRNHKINLLKQCLKLCGMDHETHILLRAFKSGVPPHAGAAIGIDRLAMLLTNASNTREVNVFPMNTNGYDSLMESPSKLSIGILNDLNIRVIHKE